MMVYDVKHRIGGKDVKEFCICILPFLAATTFNAAYMHVVERTIASSRVMNIIFAHHSLQNRLYKVAVEKIQAHHKSFICITL